MATISNATTESGKIAGYIIQWYEGKDRRTIYLSGRQYSRKIAERFREGIEALLYYRRNGNQVPDPSTERWLASLSDHLRSALVKVGLPTLTESKTYQNLWDAFLKDQQDSCPMQEIPIGSFVSCTQDWFIDMAAYTKLLEACPNQEWRTIIALARIGGLRCPSELTRLRWSDIQWTQDQFVVRQPKTERYAKHKERIVPLFPELRIELERHFAAAKPKGDDFVIQQLQRIIWNKLRCSFDTITDKAGFKRMSHPFHNMRRSRRNEDRKC
jgi:integrase